MPVYLLPDLLELGVAVHWCVLAWTAVALATAHALDSRPATFLGLGLLVWLVVDLTAPTNPLPALGLLGVALFALAASRQGRVAWSYRVGGTVIALLTLVTLTLNEAQYEFELSAALVASALAASAGVGWLASIGEDLGRDWAAVTIGALGLTVGLVALAPETVPGVVAFLGSHVATLAVVVMTGRYGYRTGRRRFVDLAALGALLQTFSFTVATVVDELSGALALFVAGVLILTVSIALERGRRAVRARL